jgi:hypothetical protein
VNEGQINIKNSILETAKEVIGEQWREINKDWYYEECQKAIKEKNDARKKCLNKEIRKNTEEYVKKKGEWQQNYAEERREKCGIRK